MRTSLITPEIRQEMIDSFQQQISAFSFETFTNMSNEEKNQQILAIEDVLNNYVTRYETLRRTVDMVTARIDFNQYKTESHALYFCYRDLIKQAPEITKLLQEGYMLIETLRKTFTGKEIIYQVGLQYSKNKQKNVVERTITLAELMSYTNVAVDWGSSGMGGFKLRAKASQRDFYQEFEQHRRTLENLTTDSRSLYPKVREVLLENYRKPNEGNMYEVYRQFRALGWADHPPKRKNPEKLTSLDIMDTYNRVKAGTQSFVSGGDFGMEQYKLLSNNPSVASLNTIGDALKLMLGYIKQGKSANVTIKNIKQNVFSDKFDNAIANGLSDMIHDLEKEFVIDIPT